MFPVTRYDPQQDSRKRRQDSKARKTAVTSTDHQNTSNDVPSKSKKSNRRRQDFTGKVDTQEDSTTKMVADASRRRDNEEKDETGHRIVEDDDRIREDKAQGLDSQVVPQQQEGEKSTTAQSRRLPKVIAPEQPDRSSSNPNRRSGKSFKMMSEGLHSNNNSKKQNPSNLLRLPPKTAEEALDDLDLELVDALEPDHNQVEPPEQDEVDEPAPTATAATATLTRSMVVGPGGMTVAASEVEYAKTVVAKKPLLEVAQQWKLADFLIQQLQLQSYENFFPIQALAIPHMLLSSRTGRAHRDICLAAPTGSGKTLAYVLPILQALHEQQPAQCRHLLRALIVLPSRDLAHQVYAVATKYANGSSLRIGLALGQSDFQAEQRTLWGDTDKDAVSVEEEYDDPFSVLLARRRLTLDPTNVSLALRAYPDGTHPNYRYLNDEQDNEKELVGPLCDKDSPTTTTATHKKASSTTTTQSFVPAAVDVLVCTPGRLVDHLDHGAFSLQHLRYLVVDEADRLLNQRYHNWIDKVLQQATGGMHQSCPTSEDSATNGIDMDDLQGSTSPGRSTDQRLTFGRCDPCRYRVEPITWREADLNYATTSMFHRIVIQPVPLQKILVSATLTRDPQKLAALQVHHPLHLHLQVQPSTSSSNGAVGAADKRYMLPPNLSEFVVECTAEQKPLVLLALLLEHYLDTDAGKLVVFTSSVDSTHRLTRLLQLLWASGVASDSSGKSTMSTGGPPPIAEFSSATSSLPSTERAALLRQRRIVVCSDGLSRGMDLPDVRCVINYDVPTLAKVYVHRCGRTARAGQSGTAITLFKRGQQASFRKMRSLIVDGDGKGSSALQPLAVPRINMLKQAIPKYRMCLQALRRVLEAEATRKLGIADVDRLIEFLADDEEIGTNSDGE